GVASAAVIGRGGPREELGQQGLNPGTNTSDISTKSQPPIRVKPSCACGLTRQTSIKKAIGKRQSDYSDQARNDAVSEQYDQESHRSSVNVGRTIYPSAPYRWWGLRME